MKTAELIAKVEAKNAAAAEVNRLTPLVVDALTPFVGKKVVTTHGGLLQAVRRQLPEMPFTSGVRARLDASNGSIWLGVKACARVEGKEYVEYMDEARCIANCNKQILSNLATDLGPRKADWDADEVADGVVEVAEIECQLSNARRKVAAVLR